MTSQALNVAMLMLGFGGLGLATFSVGMKVGQIVEAAWWKGKLQEALASTREPSPLGETSVVRERRELSKSLSALPVSCAAHPLGDCKLARSDERLKNDLFRLKRLLPKSLRVEPRKCRRSPGSQWRYHALQLPPRRRRQTGPA